MGDTAELVGDDTEQIWAASIATFSLMKASLTGRLDEIGRAATSLR